MTSKKAQLLAQPLLYIAVGIIMALVLLFGFKALKDLNDVKDSTQLGSFILDLEDTVGVFYNYDIGSSKLYSSRALPQDITYICFYNPGEDITVTQLERVDQHLASFLSLNNKENVFTIPLDAYPSPAPDYYIADLRVGGVDNPLCLPVTNGKVELAVETVLYNNQVLVEVQHP